MRAILDLLQRCSKSPEQNCQSIEFLKANHANHAGVAIKSSTGQRGPSITGTLWIPSSKVLQSGPIFMMNGCTVLVFARFLWGAVE
jgi:hypothetical protein